MVMERFSLDGANGVAMNRQPRTARSRLRSVFGAASRSRLSVFCAVVGVSSVGLGCEGDGGLAVLKPKMVLDPEPATTLAFQEVVITRTEAEPIFIEVGNIGNGPLRVEDLRIEGANAAAFRISTRPKSVLPNAERDIVVRFEPGERMQGQADLVLETDDPERPEVRWPLSGPARDPCSIALTPTHSKLLLGEIRTLTLSAPGTQD